MTKKIAVVLFNLGGPDKKESIKPYLFNFFTDKNIIGAPYPIRWMLAKYISIKRSKGEAGSAYAELGFKSPLLENTEAQAQALEKHLNTDSNTQYKTYICMRYWHPMTAEVIQNIKQDNPDEIIIIPLYPQFSTTTTGSSKQEWDNESTRIGLNISTSMIGCYPVNEGFIAASAGNIIEKYTEMQKRTGKSPRLLLSAHGLPEKIVKNGDPYQYQCEKTAEMIAKATKIDKLDWQICYQSRVGPLKWIGPSTEEALQQAAKDGVDVLIYPHAFVSEHVETLVEIEMEYREVAAEMGITGFERVPTVSTHPEFIAGLADLVKQAENNDDIKQDKSYAGCPNLFSQCLCQS